ncbi:hypothetical protein [Rivibacter subsaxonicus]|uniref:Uncharacterized protein n=1 Tax=Rivibacter subsaxonicus TaxID=457575 RepID=A0A4Q7W0C8_9BURK|nr:hypothetical protein [Rivibacter subsaxonicus]RZU02631.1 hypothetical protein EV670_0659 [Rivibacter subsaxonicus]
MPAWLRYSVALVAGAVIAVAVVSAVQALGHWVHPLPAGLDTSDPEQLRAYALEAPVAALLFVLASWVAGSFVGALVAAVLARTRPVLFAVIIGLLMLAATLATLTAIPHPLWFAVTSLVAVPLAALAAGWAASAWRARTTNAGD